MTPEQSSPPNLTDAEQAILRIVAGHMIPACDDRGLPGADDPAILADILRSVGRDAAALTEALRTVGALSEERLETLPNAAQIALLDQFRTRFPARAGNVETSVAYGYYRDHRVMTVIGMEPRAPFPQGYPLEHGDWSLLDPVRRRGKIYRNPDERGERP